LITHEEEFRAFLAGLASTERYIRFLRDISNDSGRTITPKSLRTVSQVQEFASQLSPDRSPKSVANYRSVMRRYVEMVAAYGL
jgi:uncharacterized protein YaaR (DUF327 family)